MNTQSPAPTASPERQASPASHPARLESIDLLRGLVIVLMALDHTRDFFHRGAFEGWDPLDLSRTSSALFLTRWITHFCAPVFVFLAGTGAFLSAARGKSKWELSKFLAIRGLWLVLLEITWVRCLGWTFAFDFQTIPLLVIWAIGISMIVLALLIHLPLRAIAAFGLVMIFGHNLLDGVTADAWGRFAGIWRVLHEGGSFSLRPGLEIIVGYPVIPWIGVMAVGYAFGAVIRLEETRRRRMLFLMGCGAILLFVILRGGNLYGNTTDWATQSGWLHTLFSILDCRKYPPSLSYLLMTLGPAILLLSAFDRTTPAALRPALTFGRVPLFFYLLHLPLIHGLSVIVHRVTLGRADFLYGTSPGPKAPDAGFGLIGTYLAWVAVLLILYPACRWFAELKRRRRDPWLSYF